MKQNTAILLLLILLGCSRTWGQEIHSNVDSLLSISDKYSEHNTDSAFHFAFMAAEQSQLKNFPALLAKSYQSIAALYDKIDDANKTIVFYERALAQVQKSGDEKLTTELTYEVANSHFIKGSYDKAELYYRKARQLAEKYQNNDIIYKVVIDMVYFYSIIGNVQQDSVRHYIAQGLKIAGMLNDSIKIAKLFKAYSGLFLPIKEYDSSLVYVKRALEIYKKKNDNEGLTDGYKSLGDIYWYKKDNIQAKKCYSLAYEYGKKTNSTNSIAFLACDLAYMYAQENNKPELDKFALESITAAEKTNSWRTISYVGKWLSKAYQISGNFEKSLLYYKKFHASEDSINNRNRIQMTSKSSTEELFEGKILNLKIEQEKKQAIAKEKEEYQKKIRNILIGGILTTILLLVVALYSYIQKKKANEIIFKQKEEVELQKQKIEEKNTEITDSINYARYIQNSILPDLSKINELFPDSFVLYKPKDVVSGDFYWFDKTSNYVFLAAADCTGHGVPGALMSMLGNDKLHYAKNSNITDPGEILSFVNLGIKSSLKQNELSSTSNDGMDIALCSYNLSTSTLKFSGANRPLWLVRNKTLIETKPTKASIGGTTTDNQIFTSHTIKLELNDTIYLATDGFADQFGGEKGKKMMSKNFKELLLEIQDLNMHEQKNILEEKFAGWKGEFEQVDDVLVIGFRV